MDELGNETESELRLHSFRETEGDDEDVVAVFDDVGAGGLDGGEHGVDDEFGAFDHLETGIVFFGV